jgi:gas vesicle protein
MIVFLTANFVEWLSVNSLALTAMVTGWLGTLAGLIWYLSSNFAKGEERSTVMREQINHLTQTITEYEDAFQAHQSNSDIHSSKEYRDDIKTRFAEIKHEMEAGHSRIENKVDRLISKLIK